MEPKSFNEASIHEPPKVGKKHFFSDRIEK